MNLFKTAIGKIVYVIALVLSKLFDAFIGVLDLSVLLVNNVLKLFLGIMMIGGCFLLLILVGPLTITLLANPSLLLTALLIIIFPIVGTKLKSYMKYLKYMVTEYLFDRANHLMYGTQKRFGSFADYGKEYVQAENARKEKERREREYQHQKEWEERFRRWQEWQQYSHKSYNNQGQYGYYGHFGNQGSYTNPNVEFKKKFEESCDLLGVGYHADKNEIRKAFRKMAKEYHPDVNNSPEADDLFKKINNAYEFLSDEHIERYRNIS